MRREEWLWARAPPRSRERGRRLRRGPVLPLASVRPERLGERPGGGCARPEDRDAGPCIFSPDPQPRAGRLGGGGREQGWPRGSERLRGVRWRRDGALSRSSADSAAEPSSQPRARGRARSGIFSEPLECGRVYSLLLLLLLLLLLSFGWGHSGYSCCCIRAEGEGAKMEREWGSGRGPPAGRCSAASFPCLAPRRAWAPLPTAEALPPGLRASACCHSTRPQPRGLPVRGHPGWSFQASDIIVHGGSRSPVIPVGQCLSPIFTFSLANGSLRLLGYLHFLLFGSLSP